MIMLAINLAIFCYMHCEGVIEGMSEAVGMSDVVDHLFVVAFGCGPQLAVNFLLHVLCCLRDVSEAVGVASGCL